jgi:hypothetical protein
VGGTAVITEYLDAGFARQAEFCPKRYERCCRQSLM